MGALQPITDLVILVAALCCTSVNTFPIMGDNGEENGPTSRFLSMENLETFAPTAYKEYQSLPKDAQGAAQAYINKLTLPITDGKTLHIGKNGKFFVADDILPQVQESSEEDGEANRGRRFLSDNPPLHFDSNG